MLTTVLSEIWKRCSTKKNHSEIGSYHSLVIEEYPEGSDIFAEHVVPERHLALRSGARELVGNEPGCLGVSLLAGFHVDVVPWEVELESWRIHKDYNCWCC